MALTNYATLSLAIADWLNRSDLTVVIPDFISLCEAEMKRRLRRTSVLDTITIDDESVTPPADMAELRSIRLVSDLPSLDLPMRLMTPEMLAERKARTAGVAGRPDAVAYIAGELVFAPEPDQDYTAEIVYFQQLTPLTGVETNPILDEAPDAYLYGSLLQAEPYLEHDDRIPVWREKFDAAIEQLNRVRSDEEHNASLSSARLPTVFG
jgi:hypothetical protein